ncbi:MAG: 4-hydroxy-tetrahydrodipicolinate synthase [Rhodoferax sp.]
MQQTPFSGLWIPLITPFHPDGRIDHASLQRLVQHYTQAGVDGLVVCGSTGEAASLDHTEQQAVLDTVLQARGTLPVLMGAGGYHLPHTQAWVRELSSQPIAGLLVAAPPYIRPAQDGLRTWFETLADSAHCPLVLYDIPYRTGSTLALDTLLALAAHPRIRAIKDCGGDGTKTRALIADGRLAVLAGEDAQILGTVALGGVGAIAASAHLCTAQLLEVLRCLSAQELERARRLWHPLAAMAEAVFAHPNPALIKAALAQQGLIASPTLRAPMTAASAAAVARLDEALRRVQSA